MSKPERIWRWKMTPSTLADKLLTSGAVRAEAIGADKTRRFADMSIEAKIFGLGGLIEGSAEKQMRDGWDKSAVFMNKFIAGAAAASRRAMKEAHVVILGGGFGGLYAARALARAPVRVTLLDRSNHHTFQPLLYQVATAGLNPADIAAPIRRILRDQRNVTVLLAEAEAIDAPGKRVLVKGGSAMHYDHLIVATGATHSYFGHPEWERFAPGLKSIEDALEIRKRVFFAFEAAEREEDPALFHEWLTFVVIGGGATGVELAGTLAEIAKKTLARDFRRIDPREARVLLLEGAPSLLSRLRARAARQGPAAARAPRGRGAARGQGHRRRRPRGDARRRAHRRPHRAVGRGRRGVAPDEVARRAARSRRAGRGRGRSRRCRATPRSTSSATPPRWCRTERLSRAWRAPPSTGAGTRRRTSCARCAGRRAGPSTTATWGCSRPSAGGRRSRTSVGSSSPASSPGRRGCSSTSSS